MRGAACLAVVLFASLGVACSTTPDVFVDKHADFSSYRTWDWLAPGASTLGQPPHVVRAANMHLAETVARGLQGLGFERSAESPDLLVSSYLKIDREVVNLRVTPAMEQLSSHSYSPSYWVQTTRQELHTYERGYLLIVIVDARQERVIWRGRIHDRFEGEFAPHLEDAISSLFEGFPRPASGNPVNERPRATSRPAPVVP